MNTNEMTKTAFDILSLSEEGQNEFYKILKNDGFSEDEILTLKKLVGFVKLFSDEEHYENMKNACCELFLAELH